jgi:uncharacterized membrane protein YhhN
MGVLAWALLGLAGLLAVVDWGAVASGNKRLQYICKPATMLALIGVAAAIRPVVEAQQRWWLVALALGLGGDVFLMLPRDRFVVGLGAFLLGHLAYIAGFTAAGLATRTAGLLLLPLLVLLAVVMTPVIRALLRSGRRTLVAPILVYALVISVMAASALATGSRLAAAGALLFVASDGLIAHRKFVGERPWMALVIIVTYHLAQAALVLSLVR